MTDSPGALTRLVRDANSAGLSYGALATRSVDPGTGQRMSKPYVHSLAVDPPVNPPQPWMLRALAAGLRVPEAAVKRAAASQWLEYEPRELSGYSEDVRVIVAHLGDLGADDVARIRRMVEVW